MSKSGVASRYMQKKFEKDFGSGCEMWTGEDGDLMGFAITRRPDWAAVLASEFSYRLEDEQIDPARGEETFVRRGRDREWPDQWPGNPIMWLMSDDETPFPIIYYPLENPQ